MIIQNPNRVMLDYGRKGIELFLDRNIAGWTVIEPEESTPLLNFNSAFHNSVARPIDKPPLNEVISPDDRVVIVTSDGTRPVPNQLLIPAIIECCHLKMSQVTVLVGCGTHRPHTVEELQALLGQEILQGCRVINHQAGDPENLLLMGTTPSGIPVTLNKEYINADKRIVIGFIEPHLFAGYSGGPKGICPAICGLETILAFHSFDIIANPASDYGILEGNPQQQAAREVASFAPPEFMVNVTLNSSKQITGIYSGDYIEAHRRGAAAVASVAHISLRQTFPVVITTNSGFPLDQNLYQTVKGISTAARIVEKGGAIVVVSECSCGIPSGSRFASILSAGQSSDELLRFLSESRERVLDSWQVQKLAQILDKAEVHLYSSLSCEETAQCRMRNIDDLQKELPSIISRYRSRPAAAVLPRGPLSIPTVD
ncbi:MAG: nickel-dependent lactate racemase [candidate division Zixibacteria bacterium]|nr:nickel-dependent lactate racemase [candidate division Zixibacteria bacterium]